ncbi:helix-turn-helix domain-containing protein [Aerosakkonema sp. BLCC-F183]|uniref:helix-turn-helix domain-containing protein n=1 Tax=Aerosakkonema sp. BLCC-F183 TaxID=3342834 RepID=UPI0035B8DF79
MIEDLVNPMGLDSIPLGERKKLPEIACIYFVIDSDDQIQYIGSTINLKIRWAGHPKYQELNDCRISWLPITEASYLEAIEAQFIAKYRPPLNKHNNPLVVDTKSPNFKEKFSRLIIELKGDKSYREIAEDLGVSHPTILAWEQKESSPRIENLVPIAKLRGETLQELLDYLNGTASKTGIERLLESIDSIAPNHLASLLRAIANRLENL